MQPKTEEGGLGKAGPTLGAHAFTEALLQTRNSPISLWNHLWPHLSTVLPLLTRHLGGVTPGSTTSHRLPALDLTAIPEHL